VQVLHRNHSDVWMTLHRVMAANCMVQMRAELQRQRLSDVPKERGEDRLLMIQMSRDPTWETWVLPEDELLQRMRDVRSNPRSLSPNRAPNPDSHPISAESSVRVGFLRLGLDPRD
jgi:hypothetical protein